MELMDEFHRSADFLSCSVRSETSASLGFVSVSFFSRPVTVFIKHHVREVKTYSGDHRFESLPGYRL